MSETRVGERHAGHRLLTHPADLIIEAWAPTREECISQAVSALVGCFADVTEAIPARTLRFNFAAGADDALLVAVLEEALYVFEIFGVVPVATHVERAEDGGLAGSFDTVDVGGVRLVGSVPKAVTLHGLEFRHTDGWRCLVTVDV